MKATRIVWDGNKKTFKILTETPRKVFGFKLKPIIREFSATKEYPKGHWDWVEIPDNTLVPDRLSFQLDKWMELAMKAPELI